MQYRSYWEWLEISPTTDIPTIKKAFAAKTKEYHPEEHPEEFMALQKAYQSAIAYAKAAKKAEQEKQQSKAELQQERPETGENREKAQQEKPEKLPMRELGRQFGWEEKIRQRQEERQKQEARWEDAEELIVPEFQESFDFEEISRHEKEQIQQKFFLGFDAIADNTCICNNEKIWRTYLRTEEYQPYFEKEDFCLQLLDAVVKRNDWTKETVQVFVERLEHNSTMAAALKSGSKKKNVFKQDTLKQGSIEPDSLKQGARSSTFDKNFTKSVRKINKMARKKIRMPRFAKDTREMLTLHQSVIKRAKLEGLPVDVTTWQGAEGYLKIYLPYAADNMERIRKTGKSSRRWTTAVNLLVLFSGVMIFVGLSVNVWVLPNLNSRNDIPVLEKQFGGNMEEDELFDDDLAPNSDGDAYIEDMDEVMMDMLERYEKWQQGDTELPEEETGSPADMAGA